MEEGQRRGLPPAGAVAPAAALLLGDRLDDRTGGREKPGTQGGSEHDPHRVIGFGCRLGRVPSDFTRSLTVVTPWLGVGHDSLLK